MIVDCPSCDQSYELADEQVTGKSVVLSCPPCNTSWIVGPYAAPTADDGDGSDETDAEPTRPIDEAPQHMFHSSQLPPQPKSMPAPIGADEAAARRVMRGGDRERRDLFASEVPLEYRQEERPSTRPAGPATAERNEHSVLFTVDGLRRATTMMPPPMAAPATFVNGRRIDTPGPFSHTSATAANASASLSTTDEAGVIDLKPMLSEGGSIKPRSAPLFSPATDFAPYGFAVSVPPQKTTPIAMIAGIAAAAVIVLGVALGFALKGSSSSATDQAELAAPPPRMAAASMAQATAPSADTKVDAKADGKSDAPVADAVVPGKQSWAAPHAKGGAGRWAKTSKVHSSGTGNFTAKSSAPPPPPKAKGGKKSGGGADPCGCGGNLQCAMKCGL